MQVVTQLSRVHGRVLSTAWAQVESRELLTIATDVVLIQEEVASLAGECVTMPAQVMMREVRDYGLSALMAGEQRPPLVVCSMTPDQAEAGGPARHRGPACRAIAAGETPDLP